MSVTSLVTAEELFKIPDDGFRYELVKGELKKMTPTGSKHGAITARLTVALGQHVEANHLGEVFGAETGFKLASNPDTVRAPEIAFIGTKRVPSAGLPEKFWPGPPDLAVEVLSPEDTVYEVEEKVEEWLSAGAKAVWVVNPRKQTVAVHGLQAQPRTFSVNDKLEGEDVLPGFSCDLGKIFPKG